MTDGGNESSQPVVLGVKSIAKSFGGVQAISNVSFEVLDGRVTALIGPNGAGKTTVFNIISNVIPRDRGEVIFLGRSLNDAEPVQIAERGLIRTFQSARVFPGMTVLENTVLGRHRLMTTHGLAQMLWLPKSRAEEHRTRARAEELLGLTNLLQYRDSHAVDLPMGAQKLLEVVRALMAGPRLLCLDEPAAGLNDAETEELASLLRAVRMLGIPVLVVEHNMSLIMNLADDIVVLDAGQVIAAGTPAEIKRNARVIEAYLGRSDHGAA